MKRGCDAIGDQLAVDRAHGNRKFDRDARAGMEFKLEGVAVDVNNAGQHVESGAIDPLGICCRRGDDPAVGSINVNDAEIAVRCEDLTTSQADGGFHGCCPKVSTTDRPSPARHALQGDTPARQRNATRLSR